MHNSIRKYIQLRILVSIAATERIIIVSGRLFILITNEIITKTSDQDGTYSENRSRNYNRKEITMVVK